MATASKGSSKKEKIYDRETKSQKPSTSAQKDPKDDTPEDPIGLSDDPSSAETGSMPELLALLEDDEILDTFQDPETAKLLRQISMDPSVIDSLLETPKIKFLADKIRAQYAKNPKYKVPQ